jgi:hypothetical protein
MMQIAHALVTTLVVLWTAASLPTMALGDIAHVVLFNNDVPAADLYCNETEWDMIRNAIISGASSRVRRLSGKGTPAYGIKGASAAADHEPLVHRRTQGKGCSQCGSLCGLGGTGCPGGMGRRRRAAQKNVPKAAQKDIVRSGHSHSRMLLMQEECEAKNANVNATLDLLQPTLSANCSKLVGSTRNISCAEFTKDCDISYVSLINTTSPTTATTMVTSLPNKGTTFCNSTRITFLAATEFFLGTLNFNVTGSNGFSVNRTDQKAPYYMHPRTAAGALGGRRFPAGDYTLTVTSLYDAHRSKEIQFRANHC